MATVYAVASAKGGVGKTTTTAAMATILAGSGADVVAIDADIGMANLAGALGVSPGETTLHDVLAGGAEATDAVHEGPDGLRVVPGADDLDAYASADPAGLSEAVAAFADADYVFLDAGAGLSHDSSLPLALADETLLVSTAERSALGDTEKTRQLAERLGGTVAGAAITRVDPDADRDGLGAEGFDDVGDVLDAPILGRIPEDDAVVRAATANRPLPTFAPDAPATRAYRDLTRALTGAAIDGAGLDDGDESEGDERDEDAAVVHGDEEEDAEAGESEADDGEDDVDEGDQGDPEDVDEGDDTEDGIEEVDVADEEIVVADQSAVTEEDAEASAPDHEADDVETETVGGEHVDGDDLEAMIEEKADEAEAFEGTDDEPEEDEPEEEDESATPEDESATPEDEASDDESEDDSDDEASDDESEDDSDDGPEDDSDDELAGSVPFRDDDTGTMNTVLSDGDEDDGEAESETADGDDGDEEAEEKQSRGFFSRLFGR